MYNKSTKDPGQPSRSEIRLTVGPDGRVTDMFPNSSYRSSDLVSMDTFLINKNTLLKLVDDCLIRGGSDFTRDILIPGLDRLDIRGYEYDRPAYKIDTLEGYFKANMAFLDNEIRDMMINGEGPVYTKVRDEVPARYSHSSKVSNSLLSDGCIVEGTVKNSILFRSVQISRGAVIKNCVIMQGSQVQANAVLENVILDKNCTVTRGRRLTGTESFPVVIKKGSTV
jgi:glucose-1-phosphate adenylyltransferase